MAGAVIVSLTLRRPTSFSSLSLSRHLYFIIFYAIVKKKGKRRHKIYYNEIFIAFRPIEHSFLLQDG